ncbi:MAG: hypothetical protein JST58_06290 [Bacteroidetes bacterium]|nr:hypothetical protein [Bacteroidota bacterium]
MKKTFLFLALCLISATSLFSQSDKKLVVMITRANWCPTCKANESKIKTGLIPAYSASKDIEVVLNDVTNRRSKARSKPLLEAAHVYPIAEKELATGTVLLINPATGAILRKMYVSDSLEELKKGIDEALSKS